MGRGLMVQHWHEALVRFLHGVMSGYEADTPGLFPEFEVRLDASHVRAQLTAGHPRQRRGGCRGRRPSVRAQVPERRRRLGAAFLPLCRGAMSCCSCRTPPSALLPASMPRPPLVSPSSLFPDRDHQAATKMLARADPDRFPRGLAGAGSKNSPLIYKTCLVPSRSPHCEPYVSYCPTPGQS
jgi:hypothetical protein